MLCLDKFYNTLGNRVKLDKLITQNRKSDLMIAFLCLIKLYSRLFYRCNGTNFFT